MNNAKKTFISGLNADGSFFTHKKDDNVDALNARVVISSEGKSGSLSNILGNREVTNSILPTNAKVVGSFEDPNTNDIYFFVAGSISKIFVYKNSSNSILEVLSDADLQGFTLGFSSSKPVTGVFFLDGLLYWTGPDNKEPCRINVDRGIKLHNSSYSTTESAYVTPIANSVVTLIRKPPMLAPSITAEIDTSRDTSFLKPQAHTFAFRYKYKDGETSVFSPSSNFYPHQDMEDSNQKTTRRIKVEFPRNEKIEQDVEKIQLAVKFDNDTSYFVVHEFEDASSFSAHNSGSTFLSFNYYNDVLGNAVSDSDSVKLFDTVPFESESLTVARNRLFLGNIKTSRINPRKITASDISINTIKNNVPSTTTLTEQQRTDGGILGFSHSSAYQIGIAFYDFAGRTGGVLTDESMKIVTPERSLNLQQYIEHIEWQLNTSASTLIPDWATHYSILRTKNLTKDFTIGNLINKIRYYKFDSNESFTIRVEKTDDNGDPNGKFSDQELISFDSSHEGIAIGLGDLTSYKLGYSYQEGDRIKIITNNDVFDFAITSQQGRFVLINLVDINSEDFLSTGNLTSTDHSFVYEIYSPHKQTSTEFFYETEHRHPIVNPGASDRSFSQDEGVLKGDIYLKKRKADTSNDETVTKAHSDDTRRETGFGLQGLRKYIGLPVFYGSGLNDISIPEHSTTSVSNYTGTDDLRYEIIIDATGSPDTFKWRAYAGNTPQGSYTSGVSITGSSQTLSNGVAIEFAATTGHTVDDRWVVSAKCQDGGTVQLKNGNVHPRIAYSFLEGLPNEVIPAGSEIKFEFEESGEYSQKLTTTIKPEEVTRNYDTIEELIIEGNFAAKLGTWISRFRFRRGSLSDSDNGGKSQLKVLGNDDTGTTHHPSINDGFSTHIVVRSVGVKNNFADGNAFLRTTITVNFPDEYGYNAEAMNPSDDSFLKWTQITGRTNLPIDDVQDDKKTTSIVFSETKIPGSKVNGLSKFSALDGTQLDEVTGPLRKLILTSKTQSTGTVLLAVSENETTSIYLGEQQLQQSSSGDQFLAVSSGVIGTKNTLQGSYGTINPESVVASEGNAYWYDAKNSTVVKYQSQGLLPIGDVKMKTFFNERNPSILKDGLKVYGTFDIYNNEYIINLPTVVTSGQVSSVILQQDAVYETQPSLVYSQPASNLSNKRIAVQVASPFNVSGYVQFSSGVGTFTWTTPFSFKFPSTVVTSPSGTTISVVNATSGGFTTETISGDVVHKIGSGSLTISNVMDNVNEIILSLTKFEAPGSQSIPVNNWLIFHQNSVPFDTPLRVTGATQTTSLLERLSGQTVSNGSLVIPGTSSVPWKTGSTALNTGMYYVKNPDGAHVTIPLSNIAVSATAIGSIGYQPGSFNITISGIDDLTRSIQLNSRPLTNATVTTDTATSVTTTGFTMNGNFVSAGQGTASAIGFVHSSSVLVPEIGVSGVTNTVVSGTSTGAFTTGLTGLANTTAFYYRAYVTTDIGTVYGATESVTTLSPAVSLATITASAASNITSTGATLTANISANGGSSVTAKGFVVSESSVSNPTLETNGVTNLADNNSILSLPFSFTKTFNSGSSGTAYNYRAYATNGAGTVYTTTQSFTTSSNTATLLRVRATTNSVDSNGGVVTFDFTKSGSGSLSGSAQVVVTDGSSQVISQLISVSISSSQTTQSSAVLIAPFDAPTTANRTLELSVTQLTGITLTSGSLPIYSTSLVSQQGNGNIP